MQIKEFTCKYKHCKQSDVLARHSCNTFLPKILYSFPVLDDDLQKLCNVWDNYVSVLSSTLEGIRDTDVWTEITETILGII